MKLVFHIVQGPALVAFFREFGRQVGVGRSALKGLTILNVVIIRCSKYDDETGFVTRDWRGVLPSNTLATMYSLVQNIGEKHQLGVNVRIVTHVFDESVQVVRPKRITWLTKLFGAKSVVLLVGVQTNQFPRARDLALAFRDLGIPVVVGGFHVSGVLVQFPQNGDSVNTRAFRELGLAELVDRGVVLFAGEAEGRLEQVLNDCLAQTMPPIYNYLDSPPNLISKPFPLPLPNTHRRFAMPHMGTLDSCRGCPYNCRFCCIRTVQGRKVRPRGVPEFVNFLRQNWTLGIREYFFTADNSAWDPLWRQRFEAMIALRGEGVKVTFLMQVDTRAHLIPDFLDLAARAGCAMVFLGVESLNPSNLELVGKRQNHPDDYAGMIESYRSRGIAVYFAMMIGLPNDTRESVARDVQTLMELGPDLVSFFIVMPSPGADDHAEMFRTGKWIDPDLNHCDTFSRPVTNHPRMTSTEWLAAYQDAWRAFYSVGNLIRILKRTPTERYWPVFKNLVWMKHSIDVVQRHPMLSGFVRLRDRASRRSTFPRLSRSAFFRFEIREWFGMYRRIARLILDLTEVWLQTRPSRKRKTRSDIDQYWQTLRNQLRQGKFWVLFRWQTLRAFGAESVLTLSFLGTLLFAWQGRDRP
ncbi:MAG: radical SAM protein [Patescibacteria group bacterium]|nr:radical SAM protein [Patescibacteria group bacterium]